MFLTLLRRALNRPTLTAQAEARADAEAAAALGVDDDTPFDESIEPQAPPVLPRPAAVQVPDRDLATATTFDVETARAWYEGIETDISPAFAATQATGPDDCPAHAAADNALLEWVHRQRERHVGWGEIARQFAVAGNTLSAKALRSRYRRWYENQKPSVNC